ncbi:MAG: acylphosphatase [Candidatus Latescibacteria bacterium]|nr:acylphosphatase [Candidatus Latescibacterota bacterium]
MKALITGRVQGVGFRFFVQRQAIHYGLKGYVRNLPEGGVEVFAVGERGVLEAFLQDLKVGPPASEVDQCQVNWQVQPASYTGFSIQP